MVWIKNTKAWALFKGVVFIMVFIVIAALFEMNTILWIAKNVVMYGVVALVVILQPELRKALEQLGKTEFLASLLPFEIGKVEDGLFSDKTILKYQSLCEMGKVKTGALIVVQQNDPLTEYERTGIDVDGIVTSSCSLIYLNIIHRFTTVLLLYAETGLYQQPVICLCRIICP